MGGGASSQRINRRKEGDPVPDVIIKARIRVGESDEVNSFQWKDVMTADLFKGKRVVVFSIPGDQILQLGVDEVYCISVNDAFVMRQWGLMQGLTEDKDLDAEPSNPLNPGNFTTIKLIPDGAAKFTKAMGMNCKWENIAGFGERSWRYSAVFNDMKIEKLFLEEDGHIEDDALSGPGTMEVSGGSTMVDYLRSVRDANAAPA